MICGKNIIVLLILSIIYFWLCNLILYNIYYLEIKNSETNLVSGLEKNACTYIITLIYPEEYWGCFRNLYKYSVHSMYNPVSVSVFFSRQIMVSVALMIWKPEKHASTSCVLLLCRIAYMKLTNVFPWYPIWIREVKHIL